MLILGKDKRLPGKGPGVVIPVVLSVGYNQPRREGWKLLFVTRMGTGKERNPSRVRSTLEEVNTISMNTE